MASTSATVEQILEQAIRHANAGLNEQARALCEQARARHPAHPGVLQLLAVLALRDHDLATARRRSAASLALRPDHLPTLAVASDAARAAGALDEARHALERIVALAPAHADAWFQLALVRQDLRDLAGAAAALRRVLQRQPERADAQVNLGIVLQDSGSLGDAMQAYGRAYRLREDTFGRIAHALSTSNHGRLWLDLEQLRAALRSAAV